MAKKDLVEQSEIGKKLFSSLMKYRVKSGTTNLWAVMKKQTPNMEKQWKSNQGESSRACGGAEGGSVSVCVCDDGLQESPRC